MFQFVATALGIATLAFIVLGVLEAAVVCALVTVAWVLLAHPSRRVPFSRPPSRAQSGILRMDL